MERARLQELGWAGEGLTMPTEPPGGLCVGGDLSEFNSVCVSPKHRGAHPGEGSWRALSVPGMWRSGLETAPAHLTRRGDK